MLALMAMISAPASARARHGGPDTATGTGHHGGLMTEVEWFDVMHVAAPISVKSHAGLLQKEGDHECPRGSAC